MKRRGYYRKVGMPRIPWTEPVKQQKILRKMKKKKNT